MPYALPTLFILQSEEYYSISPLVPRDQLKIGMFF